MKTNSAIILLLLSVLLFFTFTNKQYRQAQELSVVANKYREVLRNANDIASLRDKLLVTYESFPQSEIERINKVLPNNSDTVTLALNLDAMAGRHGISIKNVQTTEGEAIPGLIILPENQSVYQRSTLSFGFVAKYADFMSLLADIEKNLRLMDIRSIEFRATDNGIYEYHIIADIYWVK